ncbi:MAG: methyltransferase [Alphaproteobacteria bacterium]|nr:methyltransferase [Alphaproteobacteria bacterium]
MKIIKQKIKKLFRTNHQFMKVEYSSTSTLNKLCKKYGCDKAIFSNHELYFSWTPHNYSDFYELLFTGKKDSIKRVFELGIGTNKVFNKNLVRKVKPGASLRVWNEYFKNATIYGGDIDKSTLFEEKKIKTFYVDQTCKSSIKNMWKKIKVSNFDLIIDDGCHQYNATLNFFNESINKLSKSGFYIIEDIYEGDKDNYINYFKNRAFNFYFINLNNHFTYKDNNLLLITN